MIGLQALAVALDRGAVPPAPVLFRLPGLPVVLQELYGLAEFAGIRTLPWGQAAPQSAFGAADRFGARLDLRDFAFDPAFRGVAMIDYFLIRLGVDPATVPPARRRTTWLGPRLAPCPPPAPPGYALVCPRAAMAVRTMPDEVHRAVMAGLVARGLRVVTQGEASAPAQVMPVCASLAELCGWVAAAAVVVSTDTAMVHLADALDVPCVAIFTTHRPEWRVRDHPRCRPVHRPIAGVADALEFAGPAELAAARAAWFDRAGGLDWLTPVLDAADAAVAVAKGM